MVGTKDGSFSVKSMYAHLMHGFASTFPWCCVWKSKVPTRVSFFVWEATHGKILIIDNLRRIGDCVID